MEKRNHYWVLDCVLALTAIALGTAALCSFAGIAIPPQSGVALGIEVLVCIAALAVGGLFARFLWREQKGEQRQPGRRHRVRAYQERLALMMRREARRLAPVGVQAAPTPAAEAEGTPETLLVTSLTDVKAERRAQRRQRRAAEATAAEAA